MPSNTYCRQFPYLQSTSVMATTNRSEERNSVLGWFHNSDIYWCILCMVSPYELPHKVVDFSSRRQSVLVGSILPVKGWWNDTNQCFYSAFQTRLLLFQGISFSLARLSCSSIKRLSSMHGACKEVILFQGQNCTTHEPPNWMQPNHQ